MPNNKRPPSYRHFAGVRVIRTTETPAGDGWITPDGRFTFYKDPKATKRCANPHPEGDHSGAKCPGGVIHPDIWWYVIDNTTGKHAFDSHGAESLIDNVVIMLNGLKQESKRRTA